MLERMGNTLRTRVAIVGAGPAGSLLALILHQAGIESIMVERQSREHVLSRIRAGVLEWGTVEMLRRHGVGERMDREGHIHTETGISYGGDQLFYFDIKKYADSQFMSYGQTEIQKDLYDAHDAAGIEAYYEVEDVAFHDVTSDRPAITFTQHGESHRIDAEYVVGTDGFHGPAKGAIPADVIRRYEKTYPFGWLGILSETPPLEHLVYANSPRGFALASQRNPMLSRYYVQCPLDDTVEQWSDERFWDELLARFPAEVSDQIVTGPSIEKSIAPLRSFVAEPMRWGNLFLAGDAAHIVPPTGAKGLNLAASDVFYLSRGFVQQINEGDSHYLDCYSEMALRRVWASVRFSWWMTGLLHRFPEQTEIDQRLQEAELAYIQQSEKGQAAISEQYAGMPFES
jgi:p-hydroxybenzoate 3-monooxygenase